MDIRSQGPVPIGRRPLLLLLCCALFLSLLPVVLSGCSGIASMRSSNLIVTVDGQNTSFQPARNEVPILDFFNITMRLTDLSERERNFDATYNQYFCAWSSVPESEHLQRFSLSDFDCTVSQKTTNPVQGVLLESININYTHPTISGFYVSNTFYVTNDTFEIFPSNNTQYVDPGKVYSWKFECV